MVETGGRENRVAFEITAAIEISDIRVGREVAESRRDDGQPARRERSRAEQVLLLPVGKRTSARMPTETGSARRRFTFTLAATSPRPVADPSTKREAVRMGLSGVPPKK